MMRYIVFAGKEKGQVSDLTCLFENQLIEHPSISFVIARNEDLTNFAGTDPDFFSALKGMFLYGEYNVSRAVIKNEEGLKRIINNFCEKNKLKIAVYNS